MVGGTASGTVVTEFVTRESQVIVLADEGVERTPAGLRLYGEHGQVGGREPDSGDLSGS